MAPSDQSPRDVTPGDGRVRDAMSLGFPHLSAAASVAEAASLLWAKGWLPLPLLDAEGRLAGVVSDRDIVRDVTRELGDWATDVFEMREAARRAEADEGSAEE